MYPELKAAIHRSGALLIYLPPYSPQLNPIEKGFALSKAFLKRNVDLVFSIGPELVLKVAMPRCTANIRKGGRNFFRSCAYDEQELVKAFCN
jgi:hypothetical protein